MFCVNCGKQIVDDAKFCSFCGTPVRNVVVQTPAPAPVEEQPVRETPAAEPPVPEQPVQDISAAETPVWEEPAQGITAAEARLLEQPFKDIPAAETPVWEQPAQDAPVQEAPAYENTVSEPSAPNVPENFVENPVPGVIPTSGESLPQNVVGAFPESPKNPPAERPERKYTLGHIMICLAAVAVMAITAGVFAGLYFSVV